MWENLKLAFTNGWHVLVAGLLLGAGVPAVFFAIVVLAIGLGITFIVASGFGKKLDFEHIYPVLIDK